MLLFLFISSVALIAFAAIRRDTGSQIPIIPTTTNSICYNVSIPVTVTSNNLVWGLPEFKNNYEVGSFTNAINSRKAATDFNPFSGIAESTATYTIAGTFCTPKDGVVGTVMIASHGLLMNRYYWDSKFQPEKYSFVEFVVSNGYSIFYYDRLGSGESQIISSYVNQASNQAGVLKELTNAVRSGTLPGVPEFTPKKVVLVGHSFGSFLNAGVLAMNPNIADGVIMTGMSYYGGLPEGGLLLATIQGRIASTLNPARFSHYPDTGYTYPVDSYSAGQAFYKDPYFDQAATDYLYSIASPAGIMEEITVLTINRTTTDVTVPVMFQIGEYDFVVCGGLCPGVLEPAAQEAFPNSVGYASFIQPNTGHLLTYNNNATGGYQVVIDWLAQNGL